MLEVTKQVANQFETLGQFCFSIYIRTALHE